MISQNLLAWQKSRKFRLDGEVVYGVSGGVGFSIVDEDGGRLAVFMLVCDDDSAFDAFEQAVAQENSLASLQVGDVDGYLALFYDESAGEMDEYTLDDMLAFVAETSRSYGFRAPNVCVMCGKQATKRSFYNNMVQPMCADCSAANKQQSTARPSRPAPAQSESEYDEPQRRRGNEESPYGEAPLSASSSRYSDDYDEYAGMDSAPRRRMQGGYDEPEVPPPAALRRSVSRDDEAESSGSGLLGALLGAVGGLLFYAITVVLRFPLSALCAFGGVFAVLGYIAFRGPRVKKTCTVYSILFSELLSIVGIVLGQALSIARGSDVSFSTAFSMLGDNMLEVGVHMVIGIVGVLLGVAIVASGSLEKYINDRS